MQSARVSDFPTYLRSKAIEGLSTLADAERADTYVVSFYVHDDNDDPRFPILTVGTNTEQQVQMVTQPPSGSVRPHKWWSPTDETEARWNFAFWRQNEIAVIGDEIIDPAGAQLRRSWLESQGLWFDDGDFDSDDWMPRAEAVTKAFVGLCVDTVKELHRAGTIRDIFGRSIPVIIHELEYYDEIAAQNCEANGGDLVSGLVGWIDSM